MIGQKFGQLLIQEMAHKDAASHRYYRCLCDCGNEVTRRGDRLRSGETKSCGCASRAKHGHVVGGKRSPMYVRWYSMLARCYHPNRKNFKYYGAKGIAVCDRWRKSFANFLADMGEPPVDEQGNAFHLDRIDPAGNYSPENCRWISAFDNKSRANHKKGT